MAGAYCRYCDRRCFVYREVIVADELVWAGHMATCARGAEHDWKVLGVDYATATDLQRDKVTAEDATWLTFERSTRIYDSIPRLAALPDIDAAWADLVAACKGGFGPLMWRAVELLVYGVRP